MKISLNWLKEYININDQTTDEISHLLTSSGLEVEGIEEYLQVEGGMKGLVIGEVLTCEKHPDADKLSITTVDIGEPTPSPIVCGAPNVAQGQKVVVATVNTTLYPSEGEPFKIKKAKIRGEVSQGMICAEDEIGLGKGHDGILVLDTDLPNGTPAAQYFNMEPDHVLEIGLTPNRADATSHIGVARDLKALLRKDIVWPSVKDFRTNNNNLPITAEVENTDACPRYSGLTISGITVKESPDWLKHRLKAIGLAPINNVVDITNFVLHEVGQPLHAFDADQIKGNGIVVKTLPKGTKFKTLDDQERELFDDDLMICDKEGDAMSIAGVFGGIKSGVSEDTKNIFLESAYFSADYIRKTAQSHQLKTDASFRFERGTDPNITIYALKRAALLIQELAGGEVSSEIVDLYPEKASNFEILVKHKNIDRLIGKKLDKAIIFSILESLDIEVYDKAEDSFKVSVPPYRVDVQREADIIEEILRIYGFDNIELPDFVSSDYLADFPDKDPNKIQKTITGLLVDNGYYEIITNSLTKPSYAEGDEGLNGHESVKILNKLSEELGVMRQSLLYSGLEVASYNINRKQKNLKLFEFGKNYFLQGEKYTEKKRIGIFMTGDMHNEHWEKPSEPVQFHHLSRTVNTVLEKLLPKKSFKNSVSNVSHLDYGLEIRLGDKPVAILGKVKSSIQKKINIKQEIFYADIDWDLLLKKTNDNIVYWEVPKYPEVKRDLSLVLDKSTNFEEVKVLAEKAGGKLLKGINVFDVYEGDKIEEGKKAYAMSFILQDEHKTLTDKAIDKTMARLIQSFETELSALIRK